MRFEFATATRIIFGEGTAASLPDLARTFGARPLVVTGASKERARALVPALPAEALAEELTTLFLHGVMRTPSDSVSSSEEAVS